MLRPETKTEIPGWEGSEMWREQPWGDLSRKAQGQHQVPRFPPCGQAAGEGLSKIQESWISGVLGYCGLGMPNV